MSVHYIHTICSKREDFLLIRLKTCSDIDEISGTNRSAFGRNPLVSPQLEVNAGVTANANKFAEVYLLL